MKTVRRRLSDLPLARLRRELAWVEQNIGADCATAGAYRHAIEKAKQRDKDGKL